MHVDTGKSGKYVRHLLRDSFRVDGKVKHRTIANISHCTPQEIEAIKLALQHKGDLTALASLRDASLQQGLSCGAVWVVYDLARQLGIQAALGSTRQGKLALWQIIARVIDQGSRLSAVRLASSHSACDILGLESFNEDDLYANLDWLDEHQQHIEDRLFATSAPSGSTGLFLYDVTSSYLEGVQNELAAFGYNRDGKKGKRQITIGLLCNAQGQPLSIEVFTGNTNDTATMASQIRKVAQRFGGGEVTFVGDRGMIPGAPGQIEDLTTQGFHYITAITKPQIESLLACGVLNMSLFDQELAEVVPDDGPRYIVRRNPIRAAEMGESRQNKLHALQRQIDRQNKYLQEHSKARVQVAVDKIVTQCRKLRLDAWVQVTVQERALALTIDESALAEQQKLDGCYVLKTDLTPPQLNAQGVHARYKDLAMVEWAFRTSKTMELEMRPVHVRLASRTRGHALVIMLSYKIVQELALRWRDLNATVQEGLDELKTLCATELRIHGKPLCNCIPRPRDSVQRFLEKAQVVMPEALPRRGVQVATRKKLQTRRKTR
ncbi:MAG: IS1634 family transposase [Planctomycetia bacterium]|nr:IS1634 family transposase [Planctomycetia bacterium]